MKASRLSAYALLVGAVALSRVLFRSHYPYDLDSVNFVLALSKFDPALHQPHPPGYFLYIYSGRLAQAIFSDANTALVFLSVLASCGAAVLIYALTAQWFNRRAAAFAGALFVLSPLGWFHGTVALTYMPEVFFSALVGYLCWQTFSGRQAYLVPSAIALGIAVGVRQSSILFLGPLWLLSLRRARAANIALGLLTFGLVVVGWFVPMLRQAGGADQYTGSLFDLWHGVVARQTVFSVSPMTALGLLGQRLYNVFRAYALCFLAAAPLPLLRPWPKIEGHKKWFCLAWVLPGLGFFLLVFMPFVNSGYALLLSPPVFALLGAQAAEWHEAVGRRRRPKLAFAAAAALLSVAAFLYTPLYFSHARVEFVGSELAAIQKSVRELTDPADTLVVACDFHMLGFRHAGYYLPEFLTLQFPEEHSSQGPRIFAMKNQQTSLLNQLPLDRYKYFVVFPVADIGQLQSTLGQVLARLPQGSLQKKRIGEREILLGATSDLPWLFPSFAGPALSSPSHATTGVLAGRAPGAEYNLSQATPGRLGANPRHSERHARSTDSTGWAQ